MDPPSGPPLLNLDVLRQVCNYIAGVPDVLSFALTCSTLTEDAFRRRLRMSPINLKDEESIDSFSKFIFADEAARGPNIYGLKFPDSSRYNLGTSDPRYRTIIERIVPILQAAVCLKYIDLPGASDCDPPHPALTVAANMTSLRELSLTFEGWSPWELLGTFRSPLRSLRIDERFVDDEGVTARLFNDYLANFAPTLEILHLDRIEFDIPPSLVTTQFTAVRSLTIWFVFKFNHFTVTMLLQLFPNLDNTLVLYDIETRHTEDVYPNWRELSVEAQQGHSWPCLDRVVCNAKLVFIMALQCPIRRIDVRVEQHQIKRYLAPALRHNYPQHLHCVVSFDDGLGDLDEPFEFPFEGAEKLTHLVMFAKASIGCNKFQPTEAPRWSQFKDKLIASMRHLRLTHLRLVFYFHVCQPDDDPKGDSMYIACETDLYSAATELAGAIPTLQYIFLTNCGHIQTFGRTSSGWVWLKANKWLSSKAWRVDHDKEDRHLSDSGLDLCVELSGEVAERIMDQEELHLSRHEEAKVRACGDPRGD